MKFKWMNDNPSAHPPPSYKEKRKEKWYKHRCIMSTFGKVKLLNSICNQQFEMHMELGMSSGMFWQVANGSSLKFKTSAL